MAAANAAKPSEMMYSSEPYKNEFFFHVADAVDDPRRSLVVFGQRAG
jgi:hypothetical protein